MIKLFFLIQRQLVVFFQQSACLLTGGRFPPPFSSVNVVIQKQDKVLLLRRSDGLGMSLPGGFLNLRETVEAAAIREVKEETGLDIELLELLAIHSGQRERTRIFTTNIVYSARIIGEPRLRHSKEGVCEWVEICRIDKDQIAFDHFDTLRNLM